MRSYLYGTLAACAVTCGAAAATAGPRPAVLELFTSEGCSSCPPAEAYIGELTRRSDVLALTFHVDYWDDLGWRDRFALPEAVQRQRNYAHRLRLSSVYTPQVVLDGRADFVGSDREAIGNALADARSGIGVALSMREGVILVDLDGEVKAEPSDVILLAYRRTAISPVGRGENAGRTLTEFNIVRAVRSLGLWKGDRQRYRAAAAALPADATDVAVLVQPLGQAPIIGAARMAIREN